MIFTIRQCLFGYTCIITQDSFICGVELAPTSEEALFQAMERFESIKTIKSFNNGKLTSSSSLEHQLEGIIQIIDHSEDINKYPQIYNYIHFIVGTAFQRSVWRALGDTVKFGETVSYKELANRINKPNAVRAIGTACGQNPLAILIPCHRVIKSNSDIGQYHWGVEIKKSLLEREAFLKI